MRSFFQQNQKPDPEAYTNKETVWFNPTAMVLAIYYVGLRQRRRLHLCVQVYHEFQAQEALLRGALGEDNPYSMNYLEQAPVLIRVPVFCLFRIQRCLI